MDDKISFRQVGRDYAGKIYKGNVIDAYNRYTQPSIPSKTEHILQANKKSEAFGVSAPRFSSAKPMKHPGPGQYTHIENRINSASAKGLGGFASKAPRFRRYQYNTAAPGPGSYNPQLRRVQSGTLSRAEREGKPKPKPVITPAPGQYNPTLSTSKSITSIFKSRVDRLEKVKNDNPAPWQYVADQQLDRSQSVSAVFKMPTYKPQNKNLYDPHTEALVYTGPGPGYYALEETKEFNKGSHMFMQGSHDRFGKSQIQPQVEKVGPGTYYQGDGVQKKPATGAVFVSESEREVFLVDRKPPGPAYYTTNFPSKKKSHHLNLKKVWL